MGQGGTLGSSFTLSAGLGLASQVLKQDRIATAFFGDGASARGTFLEAGVTIAAWKLPVLWICENNGWAVSARLTDVQGTDDIAPRAAALGFYTEVVDGQDVRAVQAAARRASEKARAGQPAFIEAKTSRVEGHYTGDVQPYRDKDDVAQAKERDPLLLAQTQLIELGASDADVSSIWDEAVAEMAAAEDRARLSPEPTGDRIFEGLWA
jgi:pyruvate dehydrogenase E1 component alpha subunit